MMKVVLTWYALCSLGDLWDRPALDLCCWTVPVLPTPSVPELGSLCRVHPRFPCEPGLVRLALPGDPPSPGAASTAVGQRPWSVRARAPLLPAAVSFLALRPAPTGGRSAHECSFRPKYWEARWAEPPAAGGGGWAWV